MFWSIPFLSKLKFIQFIHFATYIPSYQNIGISGLTIGSINQGLGFNLWLGYEVATRYYFTPNELIRWEMISWMLNKKPYIPLVKKKKKVIVHHFAYTTLLFHIFSSNYIRQASISYVSNTSFPNTTNLTIQY